MGMDVQKRGLIDETATYDPDTGEVEDGALVWIPRKNKSLFGRGWFQMAQKSLKTVNAHRKELGLEGIVVFNALMARLDWENFIQVSQTEIASELDMKSSNVSRAMSKLRNLGFIRQGPKVGRSHTYQLHPDVGWKGKPRAHQAASARAKRDGWSIIDGGKTGIDHDPDQLPLPLGHDDT